MKNHLINGLPTEILNEVHGYLDLSSEEIACKYDLLYVQWEALELTSTIVAEEVLNTVQERSVGNDETKSINDLEQLYAYKEGLH